MSRIKIVLEMSQNHNGDVDIARHMVDLAAMPIYDEFSSDQLRGADIFKFCIRDMEHELSPSAYDAKYDSKHSYAETYGKHRAKLELSEGDYRIIAEYAKSRKLDIGASFTNPGALDILPDVDWYKVASRDMENFPLLKEMAHRAKERQVPMCISTGMAYSAKQIIDTVEYVKKILPDELLQLMVCTSEYPCKYENVHLLRIELLRSMFPELEIGFSDHTVGIMAPILAIGLGATIIEKHFTLDRNQKGSDHAGALGPDGVRRMIRDIRNAELALGNPEFAPIHSAIQNQVRIGRSLAINRDVPAGHVVTRNDLVMVSPGTGMRWSEKDLVIGRALNHPMKKNELFEIE